MTALDGSEVAIDRLRQRRPDLDARVVDLEDPAFTIAGEFDLILDLFFLHRPLFPQIRQALRPGGVFVAAIRLEGSYALQPNELAKIIRRLGDPPLCRAWAC